MLEFLIFTHDDVAFTLFILSFLTVFSGITTFTDYTKTALFLFAVAFLFIAAAIPITNDAYWCHLAQTHNLGVNRCRLLTNK